MTTHETQIHLSGNRLAIVTYKDEGKKCDNLRWVRAAVAGAGHLQEEEMVGRVKRVRGVVAVEIRRY